MKRINIVTGHYGSGKTEIAINMALKLRKEHENVVICDMDIVNPYFRTNDIRKFLEDKGITVIASDYASTNIDLPLLPGDILSVFTDKSVHAVLDLGGDDDGAVALGKYHAYLKDEDYDMFFVLNALRPDTSSIEDIKILSENIQIMSRAKITGLINNTNLSYLSEAKHLLESLDFADEAAKALGVPLAYTAGTKEILASLPQKLKIKAFCLDLFMKLPFDALQ